MRNRLIGFLLCFLPPAAGLAADLLTLDQAVQIAIDRNRGLRNSSLDAAKAEDQLGAVRTRQFPSINLYMLGSQQLNAIDFTFEKGVLGDFSGIGPVPANDVYVRTPLRPTGFFFGRISQPLSTLYRIRLNLATLRTRVQLAQEQTRAERQKVVRDVKRVYYGLQQVDASLRSVRETLKLYQELERLTSNYVEQQAALKGELLEMQTRVAKAEQTELTLQNRQATGKEQLNQLLGRDVLTEFTVGPVAEAAAADIDLDAARRLALDQRPETRRARLGREQAEQDLRAKKAEYIPDIAAEFNTLTLLNFSGFLPVQSNSVGLSLSREVFDWGRKKHEVAQKRRTVEQAGNASADAETLVVIDVNDKYRQLEQSRAQLRVARLSQETAAENLRVAKNKYAADAVLIKDVLQAQSTVEQAHADYDQALIEFWNSRADLERALGEDR